MSGVIRSQDGVARPGKRIKSQIIRTKKLRLSQEVRVRRVNLDTNLSTKRTQSILLLPGEEPFRDQDLVASLKSGRPSWSSRTEKAASALVYTTRLKRWWDDHQRRLPPTLSPIGRLRQALPMWETLMPDATWSHNLIRRGFRISCPGYTGQKLLPPPLSENGNRSKIWGEIQKEYDVGVLKMLTPSSHPSHFQNGIPRLGPQKFFVQIHHIVQNTKERVIWDMSPLNRWGQAQHYKAYPVRTFQALMQAGDYFFGTDIKRYYHSIELESQSKDFCLIWVGQSAWSEETFGTSEPIILQAQTIVFGLRDAPRVMEKLLRPVDARIRQEGFRMVRIMDDLVVMTRSMSQHVRATRFVIDFLVSLGLLISWKKSQARPEHCIVFYGMLWNSTLNAVFVPKDKRVRISEAATMISRQFAATAAQIASTVGKIRSVQVALFPAVLWVKESQNWITATSQSVGWYTPAPISQPVREELKLWATRILSFNGLNVKPPMISTLLADDAAEFGIGGLCLDTLEAIQAVWQNGKEKSSNERELRADIITATYFIRHHDLRNISIGVLSDNTTSAFYLNKHGGRIPLLDRLTREFLEWCLIERNIRIMTYHCPGIDIIELGVDGFSRGTNPKFRLNPIIAKWLLNRHRVTEVFLPLFHQILEFLEYVIRSAKKKVLVVTPMWPSAPWWPQLMSMVAGFPSVIVKDSRTLLSTTTKRNRDQSDFT